MLLLLLLPAALAGCGSSTTTADAGSIEGAFERGRALAEPGAPLPQRPDVLALAQSIEGSAQREGSGARAHEMHVVGAALYERIWRIEGKEQDAKEALDILALAGQATTGGLADAACRVSLRRARLAGELAHDAAVTYKEIYRAELRFVGRGREAGAPSICAQDLERELAKLAPFRPPARELETIEQALAGQGAVARSVAVEPVATGTPHLVKIEPLAGREAARIVLLFDRPVRFRAGDEAGGPSPRTFVELDGVDIGLVPRQTLVGGIVARVNVEPTTTGGRVSFDLDGKGYRRVFHLLEPYRIIVDIARQPPGAMRGRREIARVVLDPGHGGTDPGAVGAGGLKEKDVTLDVVKRAGPVLAREGLNVVLTREDDRFVPLEERTARANGVGADLFLSVHCNAAENRARHGVETYVLDTTKDEMASRVAARENATSQAATQELGGILASLRMADQATHSTHLAELLQKTALASLRERYQQVADGGVKTAGFYVLVGARMPAVLFEASYISNASEEQALASEEYRQRLADGIVNAVRAYRDGR